MAVAWCFRSWIASALCAGGTAVAAVVVLSSAACSVPPLPPWTLPLSWLAVVNFTVPCKMSRAASPNEGGGGLPRLARAGCGGRNGASAASGQDAVTAAEEVVRTQPARVREG